MDCDEPSWPVIDDFFAELAFGRSAATVRRYVRVRQRFLALVDAASLAGRSGALSGAELIECVPTFVAEERLPTGAMEARMQVSVAARLVQYLLRDRWVGTALPGEKLAEAYRAIEHARQYIEARASQSTTSNTTIPSRFLQRPGAQW